MSQLIQFQQTAPGRMKKLRKYIFLVQVLVCQWGIIHAGESGVSAEADRRPHIILMMADDLGYRELGSYGQALIRTPNLDRVAAEGIRLTRHYTSAPVCAPARCSLMTGKHGGHAAIRDNMEVGTWDSFRGQMPLPENALTLAAVLRNAGYTTGAFGKWGLGETGSSGDPLLQGFDRFFGYNCQRHAHNYYPKYLVDNSGRREMPGNNRGLTGAQYAPEVIADELIRFIRQSSQNPGHPFFAYYPTVIPHLALQVPDSELQKYEGQWEEIPYTGNSYLPHPRPRAAYAAMISYMDKQVGRILQCLDELAIDDQTLFIFTSDNGTTFLDGQVDYNFFQSVGPFRGLKGEVYEGGIRVPFLARWPGRIPGSRVSNHLSAHYDIFPTICEAAGMAFNQLPSGLDGISFLPTLLGHDALQRSHEALIWDFAGYGGQIALRMGPWKLLQRQLKKNPQAELELYNLQEDPSESVNLATQFPDLAQSLHQKLIHSRSKPAVRQFQFGQYPGN